MIFITDQTDYDFLVEAEAEWAKPCVGGLYRYCGEHYLNPLTNPCFGCDLFVLDYSGHGFGCGDGDGFGDPDSPGTGRGDGEGIGHLARNWLLGVRW